MQERGQNNSVGILVLQDGRLLTATRITRNGYLQVCGAGGHIDRGESPADAALRELDEEFGIIANDLTFLGFGAIEPQTGLQPYIFLCTSFDGRPLTDNVEMTSARFLSLEELEEENLFEPFANSIDLLKMALNESDESFDGGPGSGNFGHSGRPGEVGGSAPGNGEITPEIARSQGRVMFAITKRRAYSEISEHIKNHDGGAIKKVYDSLPVGSQVRLPGSWNDNGRGDVLTKQDDGTFRCKEYRYSISADELATYELAAGNDPDQRPVISKVAMTPEELLKEHERRENSNWRNHSKEWAQEGSFSDRHTIKMQKTDLAHCGEGYTLYGSDGALYVKTEDGWFNHRTGEKADMRKLDSKELTGDFFDLNFGMNGFSREQCEDLRRIHREMPDEMRSEYEKAMRETTFSVTESGTSGYHPSDDKVVFSSSPGTSTCFHEIGHRVDRFLFREEKTIPTRYGDQQIYSASQYMDLLLMQRGVNRFEDFEAMAKVIGFETDGSGWFAGKHEKSGSSDKFSARFATMMRFSEKYEHVADMPMVFDAISALTANSCGETFYFGGHEASYWTRPHSFSESSTRSKEYWTNYCYLRMTRNTEALELLRQVTPNMFDVAEKVYEEAFNDG